MIIKKYISLNSLSSFLDNLKNIFSSILHTYVQSDIEDLVINNGVSNSSNLARNSAVNSALNDIKDELDSSIQNARNYTDIEIANEVVDVLNDAVATKANVDTVLYKIPQGLTIDEVNQIRLNIHSVEERRNFKYGNKKIFVFKKTTRI